MKKLIFLFPLLCITFSAVAQWEDDFRLTETSDTSFLSFSKNHCIATRGDTVHVVWYEKIDDNWEIFYKRSTDGGNNWETDTRLTNTQGFSQQPSVSVSGSSVYVVWAENTDGNWDISFIRSTDGGSTWDEIVRLTEDPQRSYAPTCTSRGADVHVAWTRNDVDEQTWKVYYRHSADGGLSWSNETWLSQNSSMAYNVSLAATGSDIYAVWNDSRDGNFEIYFCKSSDNGISWGPETRMTNNPSASQMPCVSASGSSVYIAWQDFRSSVSDIYFKSSVDGGLTWSEDIQVTNDPGSSFNVNLASYNSVIYLVWNDASGLYNIYYNYSVDDGKTWNDKTQLNDYSFSSRFPFISVSGTVLHVIWYDYRDFNYEIYYKRNPTGGPPVPADDTDDRLYLLCKTWGYFKYFSQHKCELQWDTLLNTTINQVLEAGSNEEFNNALMAMLNKVGNNTSAGNQYPVPDTNLNLNDSWIDNPAFSQPVKDFLYTFSSHIYPDTSDCFVKLNDYLTPGYISYIDFRNDPLSMTIDYTNEANRLTTMFYYWNIINYFSPNRNIMDQPWDSTLYEFIPLMRQVGTIPDFHKTFLELITKIDDSHAFPASTVLTAYFWGGNFLPKIYFTRVDTLCVVTKVEGIEGVSRGDILVALKGIPIREIEDSLSHYVPASTPAALYRDMYYQMMLGANNSTLELTLLDSNNNIYTANAVRSLSLGYWYAWRWPAPSSSYNITTCGYGFVDLGWLMPEEVPAMYEALKETPAIIFDIRSYPYSWLADYVPLFFPEPITSAVWHDPALTLPTIADHFYLPGYYYLGNDHENLGSWSNPDAYSGKVYILVNEETQSTAEYTCQYLSYHPHSRVFGTQTAGADGNTSDLTLPGGITTSFTSLGWFYADGYQQQRNGVKIDTVVSPTVAGIRHGKDEILTAALNCNTGIEDLEIIDGKVIVYPNPFTNTTTLKYKLEYPATVNLSIYNILGQRVAVLVDEKQAEGNQTVRWEAEGMPAGIYFYRLTTDDYGLTTSGKLELE